MMSLKKTAIASAVALAMGGAGVANASLVTVGSGTSYGSANNNFTMLNANTACATGSVPESSTCTTGQGNGQTGGTNDVAFAWNGTAYNSSSDFGSAGNMSLSSTTTFFGHLWTAHDIQVYTPGTYTFNYTTTNGAAAVEHMTVGAGELGGSMLFNWSTTKNINVFELWNASGGVFDPVKLDMYTGANNPAGNTASKNWGMTSVATDMPDGPFVGAYANFNMTLTGQTPAPTPAPVPVPAAAWLFGSGLMGLAAIARRRKRI